MYMKLKDGKSKVLTLSYDDGMVQDIRLIKILDEWGIKGTFNINTGLYFPENTLRVKYEGRMKLSEAQALYSNSCHEVAIHGLNHLFMDQIKPESVLLETLEDRKNAERQYGRIIKGMAYPYGRYRQEVVDILKECGVSYSRTVVATENYDFPKEWLTWHPTCNHKHPKLMDLARNFAESMPRFPNMNWLFYLWGHSFEFDVDNNWNIIEDFCAYIGKRDDIWYATNMEIYDYVHAYDQLRCSADGSLVYNPTTIDVWFMEKGKTYCVRSGETVTA